jgi:hypothetical protein
VLIIPGEDPAAFDALLTGLLAEHEPTNPTEELLVQEMAKSHWLAQRALRLQNTCFTEDRVEDGVNEERTGRLEPVVRVDEERTGRLEPVVRVDEERTGRLEPVVRVNEKRLALFLRYQTTHRRAFYKALDTLLKLRKDAARAPRGFVSQTSASAAANIGFVSQNSPDVPLDPGFAQQNPDLTVSPGSLKMPKQAA